MHHYTDLTAIMGNRRLPLCLGKCGRELSQCTCAGLKTGSESLGSVVHFSIIPKISCQVEGGVARALVQRWSCSATQQRRTHIDCCMTAFIAAPRKKNIDLRESACA